MAQRPFVLSPGRSRRRQSPSRDWSARSRTKLGNVWSSVGSKRAARSGELRRRKVRHVVVPCQFPPTPSTRLDASAPHLLRDALSSVFVGGPVRFRGLLWRPPPP